MIYKIKYKTFTKLFFLISIGVSLKYNSQVSNTNSQITSSILNMAHSINENDGTANINIPITKIEIENYTLDVSLKYNSKGIKISADSDLFGMNWNLNTVGVITRQINKYPDELNKLVIINSNINGCTSLTQIDNVGYFYNRDRIKSLIPSYEAGYPNVPLSVDTDQSLNGLNSIYFKPPRLFNISEDPAMTKDYEPDLFTVIIPGYRSFDFFFDLDKKIVINPDDNYKITYKEQNGEINSFEVTDKNGTVFTFSSKETERIYKPGSEGRYFRFDPVGEWDVSLQIAEPLRGLCNNTSQELKDNYYKNYTKAWYLDSVRNINDDGISFTYTNKNLYLVSPPYGLRPYSSDYITGDQGTTFFTDSFFQRIDGLLLYSPAFKFGLSITPTTTPVLKSINSKNQFIHLNEGDLRKDIFNNGYSQLKEIKSIDIWSSNGAESMVDLNYYLDYFPNDIPAGFKKVKTIDFNYTYSFSKNRLADPYLEYTYKRLFLDNIVERANNTTLINYVLSYNGDLNDLPHKQTIERDYWGYYKKKTDTDFGILPNLYYYPDDGRDNVDLGPFSIYPRTNYQGSEIPIKNYYSLVPLRSELFTDKTPNFQDANIGTLKSLTTNLGAQINFSYEPNYFQYYGTKRPSGGLRIKSIENVNSGKKEITEFFYGNNGNGIGHAYVNAGINRYFYNPNNRTYVPQRPNNGVYGNTDMEFNFLQDVTSNTFYDEVKKVVKDESGNTNGYSISKYSLFKDDNANNGFQLGNFFYKSNIFSSYSLILESSPNAFIANYSKNIRDYYPFNEKEDFNSINGFLLNEKIYNSNDQLIKENTFNYDLKVTEYKFLKDINSGYQPAESLYKIRKYTYLLNNSTKKDFFANNALTTTSSYMYTPTNQLKKISVTNPDNQIFINELKYCYETDNDFLTLNRFSELCEEKKTQNNKSILTRYMYKSFYLPKLVFQSDVMGGIHVYYGATPMKLPEFTQVSLDGILFKDGTKNIRRGKQGIVLQSKEDFLNETTIYGYNQRLPIAKIKGATYEQVLQAFNLDPDIHESYLSLDIIKKSDLDVDITSEKELIMALDNFRQNAQFRNFEITTYTYDPLIGLTSVTPPSGIRQFYQYDEAGRLTRVLDENGKIIKEFTYNVSPITYNNAQCTTVTPCSFSVVEPFRVVSSSVNKCSTEKYESSAEFQVTLTNIPINASFWNNDIKIGQIGGPCQVFPAGLSYTIVNYIEPPGGPFGTPANRTWKIKIEPSGEVFVRLKSGTVGTNSRNQLTFNFTFFAKN